MKKALESAIANAENNHGLDVDDLLRLAEPNDPHPLGVAADDADVGGAQHCVARGTNARRSGEIGSVCRKVDVVAIRAGPGEDLTGEEPRQHCQNSPDQHDDRERSTRSDDLTEDPARNLEQRIAPDKGREDPTHLDLGESELGHHELGGHGDIHPQQIGHEADDEQQREDDPTHVRRLLGHLGSDVHPCSRSLAWFCPRLSDRARSASPTTLRDPQPRIESSRYNR